MAGWGFRLPIRSFWLLLLLFCGCTPARGIWSLVWQEERHLAIRDPAQLPLAPIPSIPPPPTVSRPAPASTPRQLSLNEAISIALANSNVVRILVGTTAVASGQTIYDPAISSTTIDEARAVFDPTAVVQNIWMRDETPQGFVNPLDPIGAQIVGTRVDQYNLSVGLDKKTVTGGTLSLDVADNRSRFQPGIFPLNPQDLSSITLGYTQPLLKGGGVGPNLAPIVIARINTERSFFQLKDSVQEMVRGVIEAYWAVVFARTDVWARRQQVEQGEAAYQIADARKKVGLATAADVAQARVALSNFKATLIGSEANLLQREAALRNIMGLPPTEPERFIPNTPPTSMRLEPRWEEIVQLGAERRPDIIELKLILEADQQVLVQARNQALPQVDALFLYQWDGLEGKTPTRDSVATSGGMFTDWTLGVNFSVPFGLRQSRAGLRRAELILARDRSNLDQGFHSMIHTLAGNVRNLAQFYEQYRAFQETRAAARENLEQQRGEVKAGRAIFLNVLEAITDWGNAISSEAQSLAQYNTELANLERETGTILETHGIWFTEERYRSIGPLGRLAPRPYYPASLVPGPNADRYPVSKEPAEMQLEREYPKLPREDRPPELLPLPRPLGNGRPPP